MRDEIADLEHKQWIYWSKSIAKDFEAIKNKLINNEDLADAIDSVIDQIDTRLNRWKEYWKPFDKLSETVKDFDREWADKIITLIEEELIPSQVCGGGRDMKEDTIPWCKGHNACRDKMKRRLG